MSQTLMGYSMGFAVAAIVAIYLALRYWAAHRHQVAILSEEVVGGVQKTQRPSQSASAQRPSMDVD